MNDAVDTSVLLAASADATMIAVAVAALQREEEVMTPYTPKDLAEDWEFKILRARGPKFRKPETLRAVLADEARAQWTLVEKFDDSRLRLKRPASAKAKDGRLGFDPYDTQFGAKEDRRITVIALAICTLVIVALAAFCIVFVTR